jgi:hypothetical protein
MSQVIDKTRTSSKQGQEILEAKPESKRQSEFAPATNPQSQRDSMLAMMNPEITNSNPRESSKSVLTQKTYQQPTDELSKLIADNESKFPSTKILPHAPSPQDQRRSIQMKNYDAPRRPSSGSRIPARPMSHRRDSSCPRVGSLKTRAGQSIMYKEDVTENKRGVHKATDRDYDLYRNRGNSLPNSVVNQKKYDDYRQS